MKIFNTLTRRKEEFVPIEPGKVSMYVCGPTVYNYIHIGNARPMIVFDTFRRYMEYKGYIVNYVSNFTDVDDKIIKKANEEGVDPSEISERYIAECKKDMEAMNVRPATIHPQATKEIDGMIDMISSLIEKGHAYASEDGTVYFRTRSFDGYGKLSHKNLDDLSSGFRQLQVTGEDQKEDPLDFVLWKPKKEGEPYWPSPWCDGRPGWHIECSVMSKKYLGETRDLLVAGTYDRFSEEEVTELPNAADFTNIEISLNGVRFDLTQGVILHYSREINLVRQLLQEGGLLLQQGDTRNYFSGTTNIAGEVSYRTDIAGAEMELLQVGEHTENTLLEERSEEDNRSYQIVRNLTEQRNLSLLQNIQNAMENRVEQPPVVTGQPVSRLRQWPVQIKLVPVKIGRAHV